MDPILDETSLVPCSSRQPSSRIAELAKLLAALDKVGVPPVLRSVRDAADRDLGDGHGLRRWCFDPGTPKDAGRLVAKRLASQPFVDGGGGLFAAVEGPRAVEARVGSQVVLGLGLAALTDGLAVSLTSDVKPAGDQISVELTFIDENEEYSERVEVRTYALTTEVTRDHDELTRRVDGTFSTGFSIVQRLGEVFPHLRLGERARRQIEGLTGNEPFFRQLVRHLRALDSGASKWADGSVYEPDAVTYSVESGVTLSDRSLGPMRDFPTPEGFDAERWSLHTKLTGGNGARLYFRPVRQVERSVVLVGYFGDHLPTVKYRT